MSIGGRAPMRRYRRHGYQPVRAGGRVWVIARLAISGNRFAKMAVTDERGPLCDPDLPKAISGLGARLRLVDCRSRGRTRKRSIYGRRPRAWADAAQYDPGSWRGDDKDPRQEPLPGARRCRNGIGSVQDAGPRSTSFSKENGCGNCHQLAITRPVHLEQLGNSRIVNRKAWMHAPVGPGRPATTW